MLQIFAVPATQPVGELAKYIRHPSTSYISFPLLVVVYYCFAFQSFYLTRQHLISCSLELPSGRDYRTVVRLDLVRLFLVKSYDPRSKYANPHYQHNPYKGFEINKPM